MFELFLPDYLIPAKQKDQESISLSSMLSMHELKFFVEQLKDERHRSTTRAQYYSIWKLFNNFFLKLDEKPNNWEDRLALFAGHLVRQNRKSSTIKSYISAVKAVLTGAGIKLNED